MDLDTPPGQGKRKEDAIHQPHCKIADFKYIRIRVEYRIPYAYSIISIETISASHLILTMTL